MCKSDKCNELIYILLDETFNIQYANTDKEKANKYIRKLEITKYISNNLTCQYQLSDYSVTIDKVNIADTIYHFITVVPMYSKCENCEKALIDTVTGLYNRNYWEQFIDGIAFHSKIPSFTLVLMDIDNLKDINDSYGHIEGDNVIKMVGEAIKTTIRKVDLGIRYGGDEFMILFFNQDTNYAAKMIEKIRRKINKLALEINMDIEISTGMAFYNSLGDVKEIVKKADEDLYREKRKKKHKKSLKNEKNKVLLQEIKKLRDELNKKIADNGCGINSEETLKISNKLDELIIKYLKEENN